MTFLVPAAFFFVAAVTMLFYRIDRATLSQIEAELSQRRANVESLA